jgi:leader peptidase (prepilin peptidase)/N-methyltransferase
VHLLLIVGLGALIGGLSAAAVWRIDSPLPAPAWVGTPRRRRAWTAVAAGVAALLAAAVYAAGDRNVALDLVLPVFAAAAPGLALCDAVARRLPFALSGVLALWALAVTALLGQWPMMVAMVIGALIAGGAMGFIGVVSGGQIGGGDIALAASFGLAMGAVGPAETAWWVALSFLIASPVALALLVRGGRKVRFPFGPALLAAWCWMAVAA